MKEQKKTRSKSIIILAFLLTVAILVLVLLPNIIKYGLVRVLHDQGVERAYVEDVDFNPFSGELVIDNLRVTEGGETSLGISRLLLRFSWRRLFDKVFYIEEFDVNEFILKVRQVNGTGWNIGGIPLPEESESEDTEGEPLSWGVGIGRFNIDSSAIHFLSPELEAAINLKVLNVTKSEGWGPDSSSIINFDHKLTVSINDTEIQSGLVNIKTGPIGLNGSFNFKQKSDDSSFGFGGDLSFEDLLVSDKDGKFSLVNLKRLDLKQIMVKAADDIKISLIEFDTLALGKTADMKTSSDIEARPVFEANKISISDISSGGAYDLFIKSILLEEMNVAVLRSPDERLHVIDDITELFKEEGTDGAKEEEVTVALYVSSVDDKALEEKKKGKDFKFGIAEFRISEKSSINFDDESVDPPFRMKLALNNISLLNIDNSVSENKISVAMDAGVGDYTTLKFTGDVQPFLDLLNTEIKGDIKEMDLAPISPYMVKALGYNVTSGHLNAEISFKVASGEILGENAFTLKKLKIAPTDEDKIESLASKLSISLDTTLELLRDKDGNIQIALPVSGDISDPKFDFQDIINKALITATKKTAFSFLKKAFVPYGTLITVIEVAGKVARIQLDPVIFEPASKEIGESSEYLERLVKLMGERPAIQISLCGKTVPADRVRLEEMAASSEEKDGQAEVSGEVLLGLAKERAEVIKKRLVEGHGIEAGRLFICNPEIDEDEGAKPRVELLI